MLRRAPFPVFRPQAMKNTRLRVAAAAVVCWILYTEQPFHQLWPISALADRGFGFFNIAWIFLRFPKQTDEKCK